MYGFVESAANNGSLLGAGEDCVQVLHVSGHISAMDWEKRFPSLQSSLFSLQDLGYLSTQPEKELVSIIPNNVIGKSPLS